MFDAAALDIMIDVISQTAVHGVIALARHQEVISGTAVQIIVPVFAI